MCRGERTAESRQDAAGKEGMINPHDGPRRIARKTEEEKSSYPIDPGNTPEVSGSVVRTRGAVYGNRRAHNRTEEGA